jgi:hypothetical protein
VSSRHVDSIRKLLEPLDEVIQVAAERAMALTPGMSEKDRIDAAVAGAQKALAEIRVRLDQAGESE